MKKFNKLMVLVVGMLAISMAAYAVTVTNQMGQIIVVTTHDENAASAADLTVIQDQSTYATDDSRMGLLVGYYDVAKFGKTNANLGVTLPDNAILLPTWVEVSKAFTPAGATCCVVFVMSGNTNELVEVTAEAAAHAVGVTLTNVYTAIAKTTNAMDLYVDCDSTTAVTQGVLTVYQPYILGL